MADSNKIAELTIKSIQERIGSLEDPKKEIPYRFFLDINGKASNIDGLLKEEFKKQEAFEKANKGKTIGAVISGRVPLDAMCSVCRDISMMHRTRLETYSAQKNNLLFIKRSLENQSASLEALDK